MSELPTGFQLAIALVAATTALALGRALRRLVTRRRRAAARRRAAPDRPWDGREDWAAGRIRGRARGAALRAWLMLAAWLTMALTLAAVVEPSRPWRHLGGRAAAAVVGIVAAGLLFRAARATWLQLRVGGSVMHLDGIPGVVGGRLRGSIRARIPVANARAFRLRLVCLERETRGSGDTQRMHERVLLEDRRHLDRIEVGSCGGKAFVPVDFEVPRDARESTMGPVNPRIVWRVHLSVELRGIDYSDAFEVPVFRVGAARSRAAADVHAPAVAW